MLFYTSGTTADPKGVMHTTATIGAYAQSGGAVSGKEPDDVGLLQFPLTHIGGLAAFVAGPLLFGSRAIYLDPWEPNLALDLIEREKVTSAGGPPVILQGLVAAATLTPERVRTLRTAGTGAAGVPPQLVRDVTEKLGAFSFRSYGLTECPMLTTGVPDDPEAKRMRTDGRPSPGCEVRIVDADGQPLPRGREGEIQAFGPQLCVGYLDPELTREAFTDDGFLRTGDLGVMDEDGYVTVTGRVKDIIIRKGENLSAKAIEDILLDHPDIVDVAVIGLPDADRGERACAVVVVRDGAAAPDLDAVRRFMADRQIMRQMTPEQVEIVDALPRNATGKVLKFELQKRFGA
jgi:acyl-CoA synthetase (AMP-forming)/AMP-acid ligase II